MNWPHSPVHQLQAAGVYMVTAGTYRKLPLFASEKRLNCLCDSLQTLAEKYAWRLQAWAVFPNHYHFVAIAPPEPKTLRMFIRHLHSVTAKAVNTEDAARERKVWFQFWDSWIRGQRPYLARISYVHHNAVHHGLVKEPSNYPWCSAGWLKLKADNAFYRTVMEFPHSRVNARDDYEVQPFRW